MAALSALVALLPGIPLTPPPPLPAPAAVERLEQAQPSNRSHLSRNTPRTGSAQQQADSHPQQQRQQGGSLSINGKRQQARWQLEDHELWLPLEVLEGQLGVSRHGTAAAITLEWYGTSISVPASRQRSLDDEVAVPVSALLEQVGVRWQQRGSELELLLPAAPLQAVRWRDQGISGRRVVLDLTQPALVRSGDGRLLVGAEANPTQLAQLRALGLNPSQSDGWLSLQAGEGQRLSLAGPWRLVLDLQTTAGAQGQSLPPSAAPAPERDPRLLALRSQGLELERRVVRLGAQQILLQGVRLDPRRVPLELRPLNRSDGMQGLSSLSQLARQEQALIAINGGYFNRVNRLPLGAMREQGRWLSGPILNRGALGWEAGELPRFDRLSLEESLQDSHGQRWPLSSVNSGYVQKGLARYTTDWGGRYQPITGSEMGVLLRQGQVVQRFEAGAMLGGVPLRPGEQLIVARGGISLPWQTGEGVSLRSRPTSAVGEKTNVLGGGPLLLQDGRLVLNGSAEGFSPGFLQQGAPRTVVASDGRQLWLLTLQGVNNAGPTLMETALLLRQEGLQDALNLDGGSSTGLVLADVHTVKGRGVAAAVHNGLGLVPRGTTVSQEPLAAGGR